MSQSQSLADQHFTQPSPGELERVIEQTEIERAWIEGWRPFYDDAEILEAVGSGVLIKVSVNDDMWPIRLLRHEITRPATLRPFAYRGLLQLCGVWRDEATKLGVSHDVVLAGTSFTRPENYQKELVAAGALAAPISSHTRGIAVDIDGAGYFVRRIGQEPLSVSRRSYDKQLVMRRARADLLGLDVREELIRGPESYDDRVMIALSRVCMRFADMGIINHVVEFSDEVNSENMCHHIAFNPSHTVAI